MSPTARKVARLAGEIESTANRLKNLIPELQQLDLGNMALKNATTIGMVFTDNDLWGLSCALVHTQQDGYAKDNQEWTQNMIDRINTQREKLKPPFEEN
jgi:hypothetical protein